MDSLLVDSSCCPSPKMTKTVILLIDIDQGEPIIPLYQPLQQCYSRKGHAERRYRHDTNWHLWSRFSMASKFLRPALRPRILGLGIGLSLATLRLGHERPMKLDPGPISWAGVYSRAPQTPPLRNGNSRPKAKAVRQISTGSILGTSTEM